MASAPSHKPIQSAMKAPTQIIVTAAPTSEHLEKPNLDIGSMVEVGHGMISIMRIELNEMFYGAFLIGVT